MTGLFALLIGVAVGYGWGAWSEARTARAADAERIRLARNRLRSGR